MRDNNYAFPFVMSKWREQTDDVPAVFIVKVSVRHLGMMIGIQVKSSPKDVLKKAFDAGLLVLTAGKDVVRLLPPLNISMRELDEGLAILLDALK